MKLSTEQTQAGKILAASATHSSVEDGRSQPSGELLPQGEFGWAETNKHGQKLGAKGQRTRQLIADTVRQLLRTTSPFDLSPVMIARHCKISAATFYMYFDDVRDLMYQMSVAAGEQFQAVVPIIDRPWNLEDAYQDAREFVDAFRGIWSSNREVLMFRNMEADLGNQRFNELWRATVRPIAIHLGDKIREGCRAQGRSISIMDSRCLAVTLTCALERFAASDPKVVAEELDYERLCAAFANQVARTVRCVELS